MTEDRLTAEDWALYGGGYHAPFLGGDKGKEEADYDDYDDGGIFKKPLSTKKRSLVGLDDDDPVLREIEREPEDVSRVLKLAGGRTGFSAPIPESAFNKRIIPYEIQHSASTLLDACNNKEIRLGHEAFQAIKRLADCADEYTEVDPRVVIYDTFPTKAYQVYVKEVVPISILLLARHFNLYYSIQGSEMRSFKNVKVKPFRGTITNHIQGLGCQDVVKEAMQNNVAKWSLVKMYMMRVGAQSPTSIAGDYEWIEAQTRAIASVLQKQPQKQDYEEEGL
jgi:hypothetical protein